MEDHSGLELQQRRRCVFTFTLLFMAFCMVLVTIHAGTLCIDVLRLCSNSSVDGSIHAGTLGQTQSHTHFLPTPGDLVVGCTCRVDHTYTHTYIFNICTSGDVSICIIHICTCTYTYICVLHGYVCERDTELFENVSGGRTSSKVRRSEREFSPPKKSKRATPTREMCQRALAPPINGSPFNLPCLLLYQFYRFTAPRHFFGHAILWKGHIPISKRTTVKSHYYTGKHDCVLYNTTYVEMYQASYFIKSRCYIRTPGNFVHMIPMYENYR